MLDNTLYYIGGYILQSLLRKVDCEQCKEALLDTENPHGQNMVFYPLQAKFTCFKQNGGLLFPSMALLTRKPVGFMQSCVLIKCGL